MNTPPLFTVVIPTHNHGELLNYAVSTVLQQGLPHFELFIIGDGADEATKEVAAKCAQRDARIRYFDFPKGARLGEHYRHPILSQEARGQFVAYLCDDDLWLPNHLEVLATYLTNFDFVHTTPLIAMRDGDIFIYPGDLEIDGCREYLLTKKNFIPLSSFGHRLDFYKQLPFGWRTTPVGIPTDLYMYRQMLECAHVRAYSICEVTFLNFPSAPRHDMSISDRIHESRLWGDNLLDHCYRDTLNRRVQKQLRRYLWNKSRKIETLLGELDDIRARLKE